jgi:hypothetical protein
MVIYRLIRWVAALILVVMLLLGLRNMENDTSKETEVHEVNQIQTTLSK